jgi:hypothetical protein
VVEGGVRADGGAQDDAAGGDDLQDAAVVDAEGQLDERAGLAEEDVGVDAGERRLPQLGDGGLLPVARIDLRAEPGELAAALRGTTRDEVEGLVVGRGGRSIRGGRTCTAGVPAG